MAVKQWQSLSALCKVKSVLEALAVELAFTLEAVLDSSDPRFIEERLTLCREQLTQISGVLDSLGLSQLALLIRELQLLLKDSLSGHAAFGPQQQRDAWQLLFVACTDFPALLEGVLAGSVQQWSEFSLLFNKVRKARNASLLFSSRALTINPHVEFDKLLQQEPARMAELTGRQLQLYDKARSLLQGDTTALGLEQLGKVFGNLELMYRNYRVGTLWGLCGVLVDALRTGTAAPDSSGVRLLGSFSNVIKDVARHGIKVVDQNIPEQILEHVLNQAARLDEGADSLRAVKLWYNLDLRLSREQRSAWRSLMVSWFRRAAFIKAAALVTEDIHLLSHAINEETSAPGRSEEKLRELMTILARIHGAIDVLGFVRDGAALVVCLEECEHLCEDFTRHSSEDVDACLYRMAQRLYQCELALQASTEEQNRAVLAGGEGETLVGARLTLVVTASKNIELAIIAVNNFVEANHDQAKLGEVLRLLKETGIALGAAQLDAAADVVRSAITCAGCMPASPPEFAGDANAFNNFVRVLIQLSLYLEQLTSGTSASAAHILEALAGLAPELDAYAAAQQDEVGMTLLAEPLPDTLQEVPGIVPAVALEPAPVPAAPAAPTASVNVEIDDEIKEVFLEEAGEILEAVAGNMGILKRQSGNDEALTELRRAFHTLKGSGRMANALALGELAWSVENVLNHVLSGRIEPGPALLERLEQVVTGLPDLITAYRNDDPSAHQPASVAAAVALVNAFLEPEAVEAELPGTQSADSDRDTMNTFVLEAGRQLDRMRALLDEAAQSSSHALSSTDFLIPVHTLYGSCRMADFNRFGDLVAPLERLIDDHPHHRLVPVLEELLQDFCAMAGAVVQRIGEHGRWPDAAELLALEQRHAYSCERVQGLLAATAPVHDEEPAEETHDIEPATQTSEEDLVLQGFLREARSTAALLRQLFDDLLDAPARVDRSAQLPYQLRLLQSACSVAGQHAPGALCEGLSGLYQRHSTGAFALDDSGIALLRRAHAQLDEALVRLGSGAQAEDSAGLVMELGRYVHDAVARRQVDDDDEMETDLLAVFLDEATELLQELDERIADWQQYPADNAISDDILRGLHTLKGNAALAGDQVLSEAAHSFETLVVETRNGARAADREFFLEVDGRLSGLQQIHSLYQRDDAGHITRLQPEAVDLEPLVFETPVEMDAAAEPMLEPTPEPAAPTMPDEISELNAAPVPEPRPLPELRAVPAPEPVPEPGLKATVPDKEQALVLDEQVRVSGNLLKSLLNEADEINVSRNRIEQNITEFNTLLTDMDETLGRLQSYIMKFETKTRADSQSLQRVTADAADATGSELQREFDTLEMDRYTEMHQLFLSMLEDYDDLRDIRQNLSNKVRSIDTVLIDQQRSTNKLQNGLITSQMVPFAGIVPRLRRLARQTSTELGKQVEIRFSNPEGRVDRGVLQVLVSPLEHMIRNAIDHGVELPEARLAAGKASSAEIVVKLHRQGANILLDITDDGKGIDVAAVRRQALAKGLLDDAAVLSDQQAYQFILQPGFSTSSSVSKISGRGVGLDVVDSEIRQIGGDIEISSTPGKGTTFRIRLPLTSSLNRTLLFRAGNERYAMLLNTIDAIVLESAEHLKDYYSQEATPLIQYAGASYELCCLHNLLDRHQDAPAQIDQSAPILLVAGTSRNMALQVDSIIGSRDLVVKSLGAQFNAIPGLTGAVILGDGEVVMVLDPVSLIDAQPAGATRRLPWSAAAAASVDTVLAAAASSGHTMTVLVVDDSITVRKVTSAILKRNGINVILAKNGMEAVDILQNHKPDLMLLDIEMPKMDGFEVASYIRRQEDSVKDLPIIMITSRIGDKHRSKAEEIGVNQYMCKPFQEQNLLEAIARYN